MNDQQPSTKTPRYLIHEWGLDEEHYENTDALLAMLDAAGFVIVPKWQPPETAQKDGKPFLITTAGPNMDLCAWVEERQQFEDYFFKQRIGQLWPYMVAWKPIGEPAIVGNTVEESRKANGFPALPPSPSTEGGR